MEVGDLGGRHAVAEAADSPERGRHGVDLHPRAEATQVESGGLGQVVGDDGIVRASADEGASRGGVREQSGNGGMATVCEPTAIDSNHDSSIHIVCVYGPKRVLTFRVVARERSFSRAARELALSQPSVSHQVAALEHEVGARLLDRSPGGLRLTRAGSPAARTRRRHRRALRPRRRASSPRSPTTSARGCASARSRPRSPASCPPP